MVVVVLVVVVVVAGSVFHAATVGHIPQGSARSTNFNHIRSGLLLCHKSTRASVHGSMLISPSLYLAPEVTLHCYR